MSHDLPAPRGPTRPAPLAPAPAREAAPAEPSAPRLGRRLLGGALVVAALGLGSCHAFWMALLG